jgi:hypothetical protein
VARRPPAVAAAEAVVTGAGSAALGGLLLWPLGLATIGAVIAGANGCISGWRGIYDWRRAPGWFAAVLDATWGLVGTAGSLLVHVASRVRGDPGYLADLSARQGRHVYRRGFSPRKRFAFTAGNTITNARTIENPRRRSLIERHEGLHVWQQRWFGPLFVIIYVLWMVGGAITGAIVWLRHRDAAIAVVVERHSYYYNPFEHWAYAADGNWPPHRMVRLAGAGARAATLVASTLPDADGEVL